MDIIRAWKDPEYRESLSEMELAALPEHPAGMIELSDADLGGVAGGVAAATGRFLSLGCPCKPTADGGTCKVATLGCCPDKENVRSNVAVAIFGGTDTIDGDETITQEEFADMNHALDTWGIDSTLTAEQIDGITLVAEGLQEYLPPDEWEALMHSVHAIQETGALTEEQVAELAEFVEAHSDE